MKQLLTEPGIRPVSLQSSSDSDNFLVAECHNYVLFIASITTYQTPFLEVVGS